MTQHYQDNQGGWHELDDVAYEYLLTQNHPSLTFTSKTQAEYDAAQAPVPTALAQAQTTQLALMDSAYNAANQTPIAYMGTTFQADDASTTLMTKTITIMQGTGTPSCTWWDSSNVGVSMTLAQLVGLGATIFARGQGYFATKQTKKSAIRNASDVATVQGVVW